MRSGTAVLKLNDAAWAAAAPELGVRLVSAAANC